MQLFTRYELVQRLGRPAGPALLCEGSWPGTARAAERWSLDELPSVAGENCPGESPDELDAMACQLVAVAGGEQSVPWEASRTRHASPSGAGLDREGELATSQETATRLALLHALPLRYHLAKLIRLVVGLDRAREAWRSATWRLWHTPGREADYAALLAAWGEARGVRVDIRECAGPQVRVPPISEPSWLRRSVGRIATEGTRWLAHFKPRGSELRVVLRGNPVRLGPLATELRRHGASVWWLEDRLGWRAAARGWPQGVRPLVVELPTGSAAAVPAALTERLEFRGVDLTPAVNARIELFVERGGARWHTWGERVAARLAEVRPDWLVTDEDATPAARSAVLAARQAGAQTAVVQHGAPCVRFGFAPLLADRFFAWGTTSAEQLMRWQVPHAQIAITGSPAHRDFEQVRRQRQARSVPGSGGPTVLVLGTVPPRDDRPDAAAFPLTTAAYRQLWADCFAVLSTQRVREILVRRHPRSGHDGVWEEVRGQHRHLPQREVHEAPLPSLLAAADLVVALASSSGVEAALAGCPVIQLLPAGAPGVLPSEDWGFFGTARSAAEFAALWERFTAGEAPPSAGGAAMRVSAAWPLSVAANDGSQPTAAARIVAELERGVRRPDQVRPAEGPLTVGSDETAWRRAA